MYKTDKTYYGFCRGVEKEVLGVMEMCLDLGECMNSGCGWCGIDQGQNGCGSNVFKTARLMASRH